MRRAFFACVLVLFVSVILAVVVPNWKNREQEQSETPTETLPQEETLSTQPSQPVPAANFVATERLLPEPNPFSPHIGMQGSLRSRVPEGNSTCLPEQAVLFVKGLDKEDYLLYLDVGKVQEVGFLIIKLRKEVPIRDFVGLPANAVAKVEKKSWQEIKVFCKGVLNEEEYTNTIEAVEKYFIRTGYLKG